MVKIAARRADTGFMADRASDRPDTNHRHDPAFAAVPRTAFPGGKVRLPRLNGDDRGPTPTVDFVGTAFVGSTTTIDEPPPPRVESAGFTEYFSYESLFTAPASEEVHDVDDAYDALGVRRDAPWREVVAAHRALVKEFHPDRFADQPADVVAEAEARIRRINAAYGELQRQRAASRS